VNSTQHTAHSTQHTAHKWLKGLIVLFFTTFFLSCENNLENSSKDEGLNYSINNFKLANGILTINSKEELINIHNFYKNNISYQNKFNQIVKELQSKGFRPLEPIFDQNNPKMIEDFVKRKQIRLSKRDSDYGVVSYARSVSDIDLDDELIRDPFLTSLLNEEREIFIGDKLYKYTEMGLFICGDETNTQIENKVKLDNYLESLTPENRKSIINQKLMASDPCSLSEPHYLAEKIQIFQDILPCDFGGGSSGNLPNPPVSNPPATYAPPADLIKQNLPICDATVNSLLEMIFGVSEGCITEMNGGDKRVKTKFWNQNYLLFSSIGCKVKFQKHISHWWASWWEKSYAEKLELGTNYIRYDYNFNVTQFNVDQYNQETKFFEFNGTKYNSYGGVINSVPTGPGTFAFDTESTQSIMNITIIGHHITNSEINQGIDLAVKQFVDGVQNWLVRNQLKSKIQNGEIKYNIINAVPFDNKVTMITKGIKWAQNDENAIVHYFDMNFKLTWKSGYDGIGDYLQGLAGATSYTNLSADIYGAAYNQGQWAGSRIKFNAN
jgi:hypothetical protein